MPLSLSDDAVLVFAFASCAIRRAHDDDEAGLELERENERKVLLFLRRARVEIRYR